MTTRLYVPAMYFRNIVNSHAIEVDHWLSLAKEKPAGLTAIELTIDQSRFREYTERMEELYNATVEAGLTVPIVRLSSFDIFTGDADSVWKEMGKVLKAVEAYFGEGVYAQLELMSAQQVYEARNDTVLLPDAIPAGYRYTKYANIVLNTINTFASLCTETGLVPVVEPRVGHVISSPDSILRILDQRGSLPFKVVFDVSHMEFQGINTFDAWDALKEHTVIVHISDSDIQEAHHAKVGTGRVPWKTILSYAAKHPEVSLLGVEMFSYEEDEKAIKEEYVSDTNAVRQLIENFNLSSYFA